MRRNSTGSRYVSRRSGWLALLAVFVFVAAVLQAGVFAQLFTDTLRLRILLPESGLSGLSVGAEVEILGTPAGQVEEIVIDPDARFYAEVSVDPQMEPFLRRDSDVFIRKQFGIAGAAYLEITRGFGMPLDWDFAVLEATPDKDSSVNVGELVEDLRSRILPIIEDSQRAVHSIAALSEALADPEEGLPATLRRTNRLTDALESGEGTVGRLLTDDTLLRQLEATVATLNENMGAISSIVANLDETTGEVAVMARSFSAESDRIPELVDSAASSLKSLDNVMADASLLSKGLAEQRQTIPKMVENTNAALESIRTVLDELARTMPDVSDLARNSADASVALPTLLTQTQKTLAELEMLLVEMQGSILFGGGGAPAEAERLSPLEVRP